MDEVIQSNEIQNVCRLCLSANAPMTKIFGPGEPLIRLADKIQACLSITVTSDDELSTIICEKCVERIRQWHTYKELCLRSQGKLLEWLSRRTYCRTKMVTNVKSEPKENQGSISILCRNEISQDADEIFKKPIDDVSSFDSESKTHKTLISVSRGKKRLRSTSLPAQNSTKVPTYLSIAIKSEPEDGCDTDHNIDMESVAGSELLINPMALATNKDISASDSHQKYALTPSLRKKNRRRRHTHFRGVKVFKRKCLHCQIHLHSKFSYSKHMKRFHQDISSIFSKNPSSLPENDKSSFARIENESRMLKNSIGPVDNEEESVEDVEDELASMEKNAPLTQVQEDIISQLKTFSCYSCQQLFSDRRSTLNHIRQHMPDLRPYTCIACLTEFPDRSIYKLHCGASFECAMKIALVVPQKGTEKYFTCNMCLRPLPNRKDLLSHLSKHSDRQYEQLTAPLKSSPELMPMSVLRRETLKNKNIQIQGNLINNIVTTGPYTNGDPDHNHTCIHCGMIYKYKPNMVKHREMCERLPASERNCFRCAHCGMTFLVLKKFQSHIYNQHNRKETVCYFCGAEFKFSNDFFIHYKEHRSSELKTLKNYYKTNTNNSGLRSITKFDCTVCPAEFPNPVELQKHQHSHSRSKHFNCEICHENFPNLLMLQKHLMKHNSPKVSPILSSLGLELQGVENRSAQFFSVCPESPGRRSTKCGTCGKVFANYPNLRRHIRTVHIVGGKFCCPKCPKTFTSEDLWMQHAERAHPSDSDVPTGIVKCQQCRKKFQDIEAHAQHLIESHGIDEDDHLACDICGKRFSNETSLKIHRGHHFRRDSRLSIRHVPNPMDQVQVEFMEESNELNLNPVKIKNSIVNNSNLISIYNENSGNLQCAVCDDTFDDVHDLRKHLWDVHCAKNEPEKSFIGNLQCDLCTNVFPDERTLEEHIGWHKENSILLNASKSIDICCDICGKFYSSVKSLTKHKKLHKSSLAAENMEFSSIKKNVPSHFPCPVCKKIFNNDSSMKKHRAGAHRARRSLSMTHSTNKAVVTSNVEENNIKPKRPKLDFDVIRKAFNLGEPSGSSLGIPSTSKKPVTCGICKKLLPSMSSLYKHRKNVHKTPAIHHVRKDDEYVSNDGAKCFECSKMFSNIANMKQHYIKAHRSDEKYYCGVDDCDEEIDTSLSKQQNVSTDMNMLYSCTLCPRYMFNRGAIENHLISEHQHEFQNGTKRLFQETDLKRYQVKGAEGRVCPVCHIKYPNIKAMKIHYIKIHEGSA